VSAVTNVAGRLGGLIGRSVARPVGAGISLRRSPRSDPQSRGQPGALAEMGDLHAVTVPSSDACFQEFAIFTSSVRARVFRVW
jgi:hypothetical protein